MPNAFDPSLLGLQLPLDRNPLQRISYQVPKVEFDLTALIEDVKRYITELLFPAIEELTGIDLSAFLPTIEAVFDSLTTLFGDLNPLSGTFNPVDAVTTFINLMVEVGASLPLELLGSIFGLFGASNGTQAANFFTNLLALLGAPSLTGSTGSFDPVTAVEGFINDVLNPTGLLASIAGVFDLLNGFATGESDGLEFPIDLPGEFPGGSNPIERWFNNLNQLLPLGLTDELFDAFAAVEDLVDDIPLLQPILALFGGASTATGASNFQANLLSLFNNPTGLTIDPGSFDPLAAGAEIFAELVPDLVAGFQNIYNAWFGGAAATGTPAEVATTVAAIRASVGNGYILQTFTSTNGAWAVPADLAAATEGYAIVVGGGGRGFNGGTGTRAGGNSGGYSSEQFDPSTLGATLSVLIGGAATTSGTDGSPSYIYNGATLLAHSVINQASLSTLQGYVPSSSGPGAGGKGGTGGVASGLPGESNAYAIGGAGGVYGGGVSNGGPGGSGGTGQTSSTPLAGGAGGGGGSKGAGAFTVGGTGGNGGYPGGGSGGGGDSSGATGATNGVSGAAANGFAAIIWK